MLERTWDDSTKLPEKYKFQGSGANKSMKAEVCIDSGTLGMEFFLDRTLPQFNQAGSRLDWSWPEAFLEFENVLGDSYRTTWQEVLAEHFPEPLDEEATSHRETKDDFDRAVAFFIKKTLNNEKPRDLQYIYMQPGGDYRLTKDLVTPPRLHAQRFKEMLRVAELLPAGDFPKPSEALALQWYYMSYHKSDREKYVLSGKTLKDATFETVTTFFQALYEQKKGDGSLERQEVERLKKRLLRQAMPSLLIVAPIARDASSRVATIGDATTSNAAETADVTTTIATTTIVANRAGRRNDTATIIDRIAEGTAAIATINPAAGGRRQRVGRKARVALRRACCTAGRTARRSTRGPSVRRTRRTKNRLHQKESRRITPTTLIIRQVMGRPTTNIVRRLRPTTTASGVAARGIAAAPTRAATTARTTTPSNSWLRKSGPNPILLQGRKGSTLPHRMTPAATVPAGPTKRVS